MCARLAMKMSARSLLALGQALVAAGATLLALVPLGAGWQYFALGGFVSGVGTGLINGEMSNIAISIVPEHRSGMASGINSTMRIVGMTAGFGGVGAVLAAAINGTMVRELNAVEPLRAQVDGLAMRVAAGDISGTVAALPVPLQQTFQRAADAAFSSGMRTAYIVGAVVALCGATLSFLLIDSTHHASSAPKDGS